MSNIAAVATAVAAAVAISVAAAVAIAAAVAVIDDAAVAVRAVLFAFAVVTLGNCCWHQ